MENKKDDAYFTAKIMTDLEFVARNMAEVNKEDFSVNEILQDSMMFRLIQVSENARRLSDEYKAGHSKIPWLALSGLRNRIVHDYGNVDLSIVYDTLKNDIPQLMDTLREELE